MASDRQTGKKTQVYLQNRRVKNLDLSSFGQIGRWCNLKMCNVSVKAQDTYAILLLNFLDLELSFFFLIMFLFIDSIFTKVHLLGQSYAYNIQILLFLCIPQALGTAYLNFLRRYHTTHASLYDIFHIPISSIHQASTYLPTYTNKCQLGIVDRSRRGTKGAFYFTNNSYPLSALRNMFSKNCHQENFHYYVRNYELFEYLCSHNLLLKKNQERKKEEELGGEGVVE